METQSGARTPLVDPFGRELEEWLRDAPATRSPYVADLVVPPVTGPVRRPVLPAVDAPDVDDPAAHASVADAPVVDAPVADAPVADEGAVVEQRDDRAFRRDRARHVAVCAPSFPEPPERLALRLDDLAVALSATSGRTTIERIDLLEDEVRVRDEDLARLAAWEAVVAGLAGTEVSAAEIDGARAFAREVFADLLADAALEADRRERAALRRAATAPVLVGAVRPLLPAPHRAVAEPVALDLPADLDGAEDADAPAPSTATVTAVGPRTAVRPVSGLLSGAPVSPPLSASGRPTPLVQPATGPTVVDREAFAAVLRAHTGETPVVSVAVPAAPPVVTDDTVDGPTDSATDVDGSDREARDAADTTARPGWWSRLVARVLRLVGRR
ncbi:MULTISPECIES: hypothetical protein [unclassified Curtobacterium]|uniref:hypothetical protein n=1 Tax=unclassified Curtobacterium TaxID=257496 RepID=UPI000D8B4491|nr:MULTISPECIES: hypothetical protein [unclassified Curtobacterium]PYY43269.1 hypothetical protein DEJ32_00935 [Curtobacterium sp. MCPF17_046]WIB16876.1 hypothetical protein DEJ34_07055 [Curtobacterium sp. MCPF17_050]